MFKRIVVMALTFALHVGFAEAKQTAQTGQAGAPAKPVKKAAKEPKKPAPATASLNDAIVEVEKVLNVYQAQNEVKNGTLPGLATADFDFKTVVDTKGGITISFLVFTIGGSKDKQTTTDVDFQYAPKSPVEVESATAVQDFETQLLNTVKQAAQTVLDQQKIQAAMGGGDDDLVFKQMTVQVGYGVTYEVDASGKGVIHLVTLSGSLSHSKNEVQTVKLTFAKPKKG